LPAVALSPTQLHALRAVDSFDLGQIRHRIQKKALLPPAYIDEALREFRRFLGLQALSQTPVPIFSQPVDQVWHTCIMFTGRYAELCELAFGRPIHHRPTTGHEYGSADASLDARARFAGFRSLYERCYGPISALWLLGRPWAADKRPDADAPG
jgi:hypothetical protein